MSMLIGAPNFEHGMVVYNKAIYKRGTRARHYKQNVIAADDAIEFFVDPNQRDNLVLHPSKNGKGSSYVFVVHTIVGRNENNVWAVCSRLRAVSNGKEGLYKSTSMQRSHLQLIKLNDVVRRAHVIPRYNSSSRPSSCLCDGGTAFVLRRKDGYPPRQA